MIFPVQVRWKLPDFLFHYSSAAYQNMLDSEFCDQMIFMIAFCVGLPIDADMTQKPKKMNIYHKDRFCTFHVSPVYFQVEKHHCKEKMRSALLRLLLHIVIHEAIFNVFHCIHICLLYTTNNIVCLLYRLYS